MKKFSLSLSLPLPGKMRIYLHCLLPLLFLFSHFGGTLPLFAISWGLALLHESAHLLVGLRTGIAFSGISLLPFGVCATLKDPVIPSPFKEIVIALAGPFLSFILGVFFWWLHTISPSEYLHYASLSSFAMGGINLLPCLPLDGGRILRACLTLGSDVISAWQLTSKISRVLVAILLLVFVLLLLTATFQFSLLLISIFLLGNLTTEQKSISHQALRELLYYKEKPARDSFTRTSLLSAYEDFPARRLLRNLSYHKYHLIQVLDQNQVPVKTLTESQILEALLHRSIRITLGEI